MITPAKPSQPEPADTVRVQIFGAEGSESMTIYGAASAQQVADEIFQHQNATLRRTIRRRGGIFVPPDRNSISSVSGVSEVAPLQKPAADSQHTEPGAETQREDD